MAIETCRWRGREEARHVRHTSSASVRREGKAAVSAFEDTECALTEETSTPEAAKARSTPSIPTI